MLRHAERYPWLRSESLTDAESVVVVVIDGRNLEDGVQHFGKGRFAPPLPPSERERRGKPYFVSNLSARARLSSFPTSTSWSPGTATP